MTLRAVVIGVLLSLAGIWWMHQASLVQTPGQPYAPVYLLSVPPMPALIFLFLLAAGASALARSGRLRVFSPRELMVIYMLMVVAVPLTTFGIIEMLLPWPTSPTYLGTPQDGLDELQRQYFPSWAAPQDPEVLRMMFEGAPDGAVPWRHWLAPLGAWSVFVTLIFAATLCLMSMFHRQWSQHERLRYPLLLLPLSVADQSGRHAEIRGIFRHPLTWIAIALVFIHHALNVAHSFNPAVLALMDRYPVGKVFTEKPWTAFRALTFFHRPQLIGLSYFVAVDVLFSGWFFFVFQMALQMFADIFGFRAPGGFPFAPQQGSGAFIALFFALLWVGRSHLWSLARAGLNFDFKAHRDEPLAPPLMVYGFLGAFLALIVWSVQMHLSLWLAFSYFALLIGWAVVYARIRAEAGIASMWAFPFDQHPQFLTATVGSRGLIRGSDASDLVILSLFSWLSRGYFPSMSGYVIENEKLAQETEVPARQVPWLMLLALAVGLAGGYYVTLRSYYDLGANVLHGGTSSGGYNVRSAMSVWSGVSSAIKSPGPPDTRHLWGVFAGSVVTVALVASRRAWLRFPFHPLGYAMALNYGYALWGPFLVTWVLKLLIDRLGGADWYRKLMPFFLGLATGDLLAGGLLWLIMAVFGSDVTNGYLVQFG